jgi:hypothetical protein
MPPAMIELVTPLRIIDLFAMNRKGTHPILGCGTRNDFYQWIEKVADIVNRLRLFHMSEAIFFQFFRQKN